MQLRLHKIDAVKRLKVFLLGGGYKKNKNKKTQTGRFTVSQHSYFTVRLGCCATIVQPSVCDGGDASLVRPLLQGFVRFVCREEGHPVGPKVGVEVRGLVKAPAAHLAA